MKIRSRWLNLALSCIGTFGLRLLFLAVRVDHRHIAPEGTPYVRPKGTQRYTFSIWHDQIIMAVFGRRTFKLAGLISQHRDGGYLADSAKVAGIQPVRGSTSRGGMEAVREILALPDHHLAMTPDGPRGPHRKIKEGIIYIASRSQRPVVPTALVADRFWSIRGSWTNMIIPKPFAKVLLIAGTPFDVPGDLPREEMSGWASRVEAEMERLEGIAVRMLSGDESAARLIDRPSNSAQADGEHYTPHSQAA